MPTIASSVVPPPKSWDEFEDITLAAAKLRWGSDDFYRHGRSGQKQDGVDVYGLDDKNRQIGLQCKNTVDGVSFAVVEAEVANAETFEPTLDRLYIATTAKRDATLQKQIRILSAKRRKAGQFRVDILFWDDICQDIATNDDIFFSHYPQFRSKVNEVRAHDRARYNELTALLRSDGVIGFLDRNNMAGFSFLEAKFEPLRQFCYEWNQPEREFLLPELEEIRRALWDKVNSYTDLLATETFPTRHPDRHTVPPEWEHEQPERFWRVVKKFHELAGEIVTLHRDLIRTGKAQLIAGS
ncbi:hypothetical protein [Methylorubrum sp. SB2]|uniref:hypothetical protein n=1 Tax=Methylorubrum subtropicum TaxID=3138812 RepID=UPI00313AA627